MTHDTAEDRDEPIKIDLDPEDVLRALLAVMHKLIDQTEGRRLTYPATVIG